MQGIHHSHGHIKSMTSVALLVLAVAVSPAAFSLTKMQQTEAPAPPPTKSESKLVGHPWKLVALNGKPLDPKPPMIPQFTMMEDGSRIAGFSGCNRFMGTYSLSDDKLSFNSDFVMTRKACVKMGDVESEFVKALQSVDSWKIVDGTLEFYHQKAVVLSFQTNPSS
jgi:heat shock protein HslJ